MNYHNITTDDMLNGDGLRVVLWTAGCIHHCKGCQNPITWNPNGGIPFDETAEEEFVEKLSKDYISGATFSGGDPLYPSNRQPLMPHQTQLFLPLYLSCCLPCCLSLYNPL